MKYAVILERDEDGYFVASVPALSGCFTEGKTLEEVMANIKEAIELYSETEFGKCLNHFVRGNNRKFRHLLLRP